MKNFYRAVYEIITIKCAPKWIYLRKTEKKWRAIPLNNGKPVHKEVLGLSRSGDLDLILEEISHITAKLHSHSLLRFFNCFLSLFSLEMLRTVDYNYLYTIMLSINNAKRQKCMTFQYCFYETYWNVIALYCWPGL